MNGGGINVGGGPKKSSGKYAGFVGGYAGAGTLGSSRGAAVGTRPVSNGSTGLYPAMRKGTGRVVKKNFWRPPEALRRRSNRS